MRFGAVFFALAAVAIVAAWGWLGAAVEMPTSPLGPGEKIPCVSYAPFRGDQDPFGPDVPIDPRQIEEDLVRLQPLTDCIRTYSVDHGLDQIPEIAERHGMKVMLGLWLSSLPDLSRHQTETAIALARRFPDVIQSIVVGNEVLLRGEMSAPDLVNTIRAVKAQVTMPVTYADVWEFWLRYREIATAVDFITIHILPYWEDFPIPVDAAAAHVGAIRSQVAAAFPNREILIGEFGWPSAGRMREGALPSPANQARVVQQVLAQAKRDGYRVNVIEAFDQPWKRLLEGTVGGHWGLYDAYGRQAKFTWGAAVSNHAGWRWQAAGGVALAAAIFASGLAARRRAAAALGLGQWLAIAAMAFVSGTLIGWTAENVPLESLSAGDWLRSLAWALVALAAPVACAAAVASGLAVPSFAAVLGRNAYRSRPPLTLMLGALLIVLAVLAMQAALGLDFDPRYRDFPFAPLTGGVFPFLLVSLLRRDLKSPAPKSPAPKSPRPTAEVATAALLGLSAIYIVFNETLANWQALWFCAGVAALALTLVRARDVPG
ncbi:MAG TPA: beta-(1-6) glucans synthase [Xanthobacteraceae bacterium]|nr:beta-(1-6) glucans synthase [Xanthobacteraceae bacterium]